MTLKKLFEKWQEGMQQNNGWNALFWCNHDQPRIVSRMGDENRCWKESAKMLAAAVHMMRGTPYIYQGEELGKTKEEALKILASKSRDNSRTPMQWSAEKNAGFSDADPWLGVPENYKEINAEKETKETDSIYSFYRRLIELRKESNF